MLHAIVMMIKLVLMMIKYKPLLVFAATISISYKLKANKIKKDSHLGIDQPKIYLSTLKSGSCESRMDISYKILPPMVFIYPQ